MGDGDFTVRADPSGISEIDTAATALNYTAERIGDLVDSERAVTAHASHQLRTPLAGLRLCLENALQTPGADFRTATHDAVAVADRLERTIDDLVMLARDRDRRTEPPDIPTLLNQTEALWDALLVPGGRSLRIVTDPDLRPPRASTAALRQILAVLIENAARHGRGQVTIHARETISSVAIDVSDDGTESNTDDGVFDRSSADGHGIGLRLARSLAEAEGGRLLLTGRKPTTFTLFLAEDDEQR